MIIKCGYCHFNILESDRDAHPCNRAYADGQKYERQRQSEMRAALRQARSALELRNRTWTLEGATQLVAALDAIDAALSQAPAGADGGCKVGR